MNATERKLVNALRGLLEIKYRIDGCPQPDCTVCKDTKARIKASELAIEHATKKRRSK